MPHVAAQNRLESGEAYVVFGSSEPFDGILEPTSLNGSNGFSMTVSDPYAQAGQYVADAGDVNGDGLADFLVTSSRFGPQQRVFLVFGSQAKFKPTIDLLDLNGLDGIRFDQDHGVRYSNDFRHPSVGAIGDVNHDSLADLAFAPADGRAFIMYGPRQPGLDRTLGTGSIDETLDVAANTSVTYVVTGHVPSVDVGDPDSHRERLHRYRTA